MGLTCAEIANSEIGTSCRFPGGSSGDVQSAAAVGLRVHLWAHEFEAARGGVQAYSTHLREALRLAVGPNNLRVFSKNDTGPQLRAVAPRGCIASGSWPKPIRSAAFAARSFAASLNDRPDLVILTHLNFSPISYWLARTTRIPYWCIAHGVESWGLKHTARVRGLRAASRILAVSSYTRERVLGEQRLRPERVGLLPNTFLPDKFRPAPKPVKLLQRHALGAHRKIILTVARLADTEKYKGYDQILRALPRILSSVPEAHYILVGDGKDRGRIEQLVATLGLTKAVTLTGFVPDSELVDYYNLCDVFAMPSKGEGFGIVYLEALSCGKPALAGNGDGSSEPLQNGRLGVLVNPDSTSEIGESLVAILKGTYPLPALYRPEELRARAIQAFGPQRFFSLLMYHLEEFIDERRLGTAGCRHD